MKIIFNNVIPFGRNFAAINLFGVLFIKKGVTVNDVLINHERIHSAQIRELLWIPFYLVYFIEWLVLLIRFRGDVLKSYREISFEREAYDNERDLNYLYTRKPFQQWRKR